MRHRFIAFHQTNEITNRWMRMRKMIEAGMWMLKLKTKELVNVML